MSIAVAQVTSRAELQAFIDFPLRHYPRDRYVPLWQDTIRGWYHGTGPHADHGPVHLLLARDRAGRVVGRSTVHADSRMDAKLGARVQLMGLTDVSERVALQALAADAERRARADGRTVLLGPVSLLPNQHGGVITSGFDERGFVDAPWNPPGTAAAWEAAGFVPIWPAHTWICEDLAALDPARVFPRGELPDGIELHYGDRGDLDNQLPVLRSMLNASFGELPYFTPITPEELADQTDGLAHLLDESLLLYAQRDDEPLAFILTLPDLSEFVMATGGRLRIVDQLRLLLTRRRYRDEAVLIIKGTVPGARGLGLMSALSRQLLVNLQRGGYRTLRVTFVGEENVGSAAQFEAMGGRRLHGVCFYRRELA